MNDTEALEKLLDSLKKEIPLRETPRWKGVCPEMLDCAPPGPVEIERRPAERAEPPAPGCHTLWSENKETIVFGILASLCVLVVGVFSGVGYVVLIGGISFLMFSLIMGWVLIEHLRDFKQSSKD